MFLCFSFPNFPLVFLLALWVTFVDFCCLKVSNDNETEYEFVIVIPQLSSNQFNSSGSSSSSSSTSSTTTSTTLKFCDTSALGKFSEHTMSNITKAIPVNHGFEVIRSWKWYFQWPQSFSSRALCLLWVSIGFILLSIIFSSFAFCGWWFQNKYISTWKCWKHTGNLVSEWHDHDIHDIHVLYVLFIALLHCFIASRRHLAWHSPLHGDIVPFCRCRSRGDHGDQSWVSYQSYQQLWVMLKSDRSASSLWSMKHSKISKV